MTRPSEDVRRLWEDLHDVSSNEKAWEILRQFRDDTFAAGVASVLTIRCARHLAVPAYNATELMGGECGACIAEAFALCRIETTAEANLAVPDATGEPGA